MPAGVRRTLELRSGVATCYRRRADPTIRRAATGRTRVPTVPQGI